MALIAFLIDIEEGHLLPSFSLAHSLKRFGHEVIYLTVPDNEEEVRAQGFEFVAILEGIYPKGFNRKLKEFVKRQGYQSAKVDNHHIEILTDELIELVLKGIKPRLFVVSCFLHIEALVLYYKFKIDPIIFTPFIREINSSVYQDCINEIMDLPGNKAMKLIELVSKFGVDVGSLAELAGPLNGFCELVACSGEFCLGDRPNASNFHYIGPSVFRLAASKTSQFFGNTADRQIIYASMGSQVTSYGDLGSILLNKIINVMSHKEMSGMHLVLSIGPEREIEEFGSVPGNVTLVKWVCQTDILKVASLAITHGGLGTVKECIYYGVPMIVIPISRDQPSNARRIEACKLGLKMDTNEVEERDLLSNIQNILGNDIIKDSVKRMQDIFRRQEDENFGAHIIEGLLKVKETDKIKL